MQAGISFAFQSNRSSRSHPGFRGSFRCPGSTPPSCLSLQPDSPEARCPSQRCCDERWLFFYGGLTILTQMISSQHRPLRCARGPSRSGPHYCKESPALIPRALHPAAHSQHCKGARRGTGDGCVGSQDAQLPLQHVDYAEVEGDQEASPAVFVGIGGRWVTGRRLLGAVAMEIRQQFGRREWVWTLRLLLLLYRQRCCVSEPLQAHISVRLGDHFGLAAAINVYAPETSTQ